jgi:hypothetical protein
MAETLPTLVAMCEGMDGSERVGWILIPPVIVLAWGLFVWVCVWRDTEPDERGSQLGLLCICAATGALIFLVPNGVSGNGDYLGRFFISLLVAGGIGLFWPLLTGRLIAWRTIGTAVAGDVLVPGGLVLLLFWMLGLSGSCLG